jgi:hypothetical protein
MNKKNIALFLCCLTFSCVWSLSLTGFAGIEKGYIGEYVFQIQEDDSLYELSRLIWDIDTVYTAGASVSVKTSKKSWGLFQFNTGLQVFFPQKSGFLQDNDFLNGNGVLTHYSKHENQIEGVSLSCISVYRGLDWIGLCFGIKSGIISFLGSNGYKQYPSESQSPYTPWSENIPPVYFSGDEISYQITSLNFYLGIDLQIFFSDRFHISVQGFCSPYSYYLCIDNHILKSKVNVDSVSSIFSTYESNVYGGFLINADTEIGITLRQVKILLSKGKSFQKIDSELYQISNVLGGFSQDRYSVILSFTKKI